MKKTATKKIGFPMIHNFDGDPRDFIPDLFAFMDRYEGVEFYLEEGYGSRLGYSAEDYLKASSKIHFVPMREAYEKDVTMILKDPDLEYLEWLRDGSVLFTMIHYCERPAEVALIKRKNIKAFSMDSIVDDKNARMFVDYVGTTYCAVLEAVKALKANYDKFASPEREPLKAVIVGCGPIGQGAAKAFEVCGDAEFLGKPELTGFLPTIVTRTITQNEAAFNKVLKTADILVDATQRKGTLAPVVTNKQIGLLPEHAIILDIVCERYDYTVEPHCTRAFEGTVEGNPGKYVIYPDDPYYDEQIPDDIDATNRRIVVSCNAWPGMDTARSVKHYYELMKNYVGIIIAKDYQDVTLDSDNLFERGLARAKLSYYEEFGL